MSLRKCGACDFFDVINVQGSGKFGICRLMPPVTLPTPDGRKFATRYPSVSPTDWCGDFMEARPPK